MFPTNISVCVYLKGVPNLCGYKHARAVFRHVQDAERASKGVGSGRVRTSNPFFGL